MIQPRSRSERRTYQYLTHPLFGTVSGHFRPEMSAFSGPGVAHHHFLAAGGYRRPKPQWAVCVYLYEYRLVIVAYLAVGSYRVQAERRYVPDSPKSAPDAHDGCCVAVDAGMRRVCVVPCRTTRECVLVVGYADSATSRIANTSRRTLTVRGSWLVVRALVRNQRRVSAPVARQASDSRSA